MRSPLLPAQFSLFRQRRIRGFDPVTRYYDPVKEELAERIRKAGQSPDVDALRDTDRRLFGERMRHSWQRQNSDRAQLVRLVVIMGLVMAILYYIVRSFALLSYWDA
jgi:hypothetical protein